MIHQDENIQRFINNIIFLDCALGFNVVYKTLDFLGISPLKRLSVPILKYSEYIV